MTTFIARYADTLVASGTVQLPEPIAPPPDTGDLCHIFATPATAWTKYFLYDDTDHFTRRPTPGVSAPSCRVTQSPDVGASLEIRQVSAATFEQGRTSEGAQPLGYIGQWFTT